MGAIRDHEAAVAEAARFGEPVPVMPPAARPGWVPVAVPKRETVPGRRPSLPPARVCRMCSRAIPTWCRADKVYCSDRCRQVNYDRNSRGRRSGPRAPRVLPVFEFCVHCCRSRPREGFGWWPSVDGVKHRACGTCRDDWAALSSRMGALRTVGLRFR